MAITNALQLDAVGRRAGPISALISSPVPSLKSFNPLPSLSVFTADTLRYAVTLNICNVPAVPRSNSVPNLSAIEQSAAELDQKREFIEMKRSQHKVTRKPYTIPNVINDQN